MFCQVAEAHPVIVGQNQYINPMAMMINKNMMNGGEKMKAKKRFQEVFPFRVFRPCADWVVFLLLAGIALLYLNGCCQNHRTASGLLIEEPAQGVFDFGID